MMIYYINANLELFLLIIRWSNPQCFILKSSIFQYLSTISHDQIMIKSIQFHSSSEIFRISHAFFNISRAFFSMFPCFCKRLVFRAHSRTRLSWGVGVGVGMCLRRRTCVRCTMCVLGCWGWGGDVSPSLRLRPRCIMCVLGCWGVGVGVGMCLRRWPWAKPWQTFERRSSRAKKTLLAVAPSILMSKLVTNFRTHTWLVEERSS